VITRELLVQQGKIKENSSGRSSSGGSFLPTPVIVVLVVLLLAAATFVCMQVSRRLGGFGHGSSHRFDPGSLHHRGAVTRPGRVTASYRTILIGRRQTALSPRIWSESNHHGDPTPTREGGQASTGPRAIRTAAALPARAQRVAS
jgi:hypothetical protein